MLLMLHFFIIPIFLSVFFKFCATLDKNVAEDGFLSTPELISKYGYPAETHQVITQDGYILEIHRIPQGKNSGKIVDSKKVVLITHGILGSSADFVLNGPDKALAYFLADSGYDVWLLNCRGNTYSRNHTSLNPKCRTFWNFSYHEMAIYDLPNTIDYILQTTNNKNLNYIGHSQGTTILFVLSSILPEYNQKIRMSIHLAPIAFTRHLKSPLLRAIAPFNRPLLDSLKLLDFNDFLPASRTRTKITNAVCADGRFTQPICTQIFFLGGKNYPKLNRTILPAIFGHFPAGSSVKQIQHYSQGALSGHFRQFDHGLIKNKLIYNTISPPDYNLTNVVAPVVLFTSGKDLVSDLEDVDNLVKRLPNLKQKIPVADPNFVHTDYLYATDAKQIVYKLILQIIESSK